jgi:hypothetical protein
LEAKKENALGCETVTQGKMFDEKKRGKKSRETVPVTAYSFKRLY